jgi:hypothetical protein
LALTAFFFGTGFRLSDAFAFFFAFFFCAI